MFEEKGWIKFPLDAQIARWVAQAAKSADRVLSDPEMRGEWLQCEGTWFVGVDALPSDETGAIEGVPLRGEVIEWLKRYETKALHPAQLSVMYEGYPKPRKGESESAFRYRLNRDAAHVDGLLPVGAQRQRMLKEPHAYVLGLPLNESAAGASPLVVWEGSHVIMAEVFLTAFLAHAPQDWCDIDVTSVYQAARKKVFETCPRVEITANPGEAYVIHRLSLHGVAPWRADAGSVKEGRRIAYLRPELKHQAQWPYL